MTPTLDRRTTLAVVATGLAGSITGCLGEPSFPDADVVAGPDGRLVFEPAEITVASGDTVTWGFASSGHNVSCRPNDGDDVTLPDDAEPFASFGPNESPGSSYVPQGETFEHSFAATGTYRYACVPHVAQGMVGTIHVE